MRVAATGLPATIALFALGNILILPAASIHEIRPTVQNALAASKLSTIEGPRRVVSAFDVFSVQIVAAGDVVDCLHLDPSCTVQILRDNQVVKQGPLGGFPSFSQGVDPSTGVRRASPVGLGFVLEEAGTYRARLLLRGQMVAESAPFSVEPWGVAVHGVQLSIATDPGGYVRGQPILINVRMRHVGSQPVCVNAADDNQTLATRSMDVGVRDDSSDYGWTLWDERPTGGFDFSPFLPGQHREARIDLRQWVRRSPTDHTRVGDRHAALRLTASVRVVPYDDQCGNANARVAAYDRPIYSNVVRLRIE